MLTDNRFFLSSRLSGKQFAGKALMVSFLLLLLCTFAHAQSAATTTVSGTVYNARTSKALPLPHVLVYVTTSTPDPLPNGVQCLTTASIPSGAITYTTSAVDGTFTLKDVPVSTAYTLVIQAGKWRRQFPLTVDVNPVTGLELHMPANHNQGDIPLIAIATGAVDGFECTFRDMGIDDAEFTDDKIDPTFTGGRIHLYKGVPNSGAIINFSTPSASLLVNDPTLLSKYDVVMFPCQGNPVAKTSTELNNIVTYANAGGRIFATHYSYDWLNSDGPYYSPFTGVANWHGNQISPSPDPGIATVNTGFTDGSDLAQWLYNIGATYGTTKDQVQISTLRRDLDNVISPTQSWLTLSNSTNAPNAIMQFTFNTPVGAAAANQCGRVLFNEYHVMNLSTSGRIYPAECPTTTSITAQEAMLQYALFDLSAFVQPVVVPTLSLTFSPSPMVVYQGDAADSLTLTIANTSSSVAIDPSAILTLAVPNNMTVTSLTDASGGWNCTPSTLTCTRTTSIASSASTSVTLTASVATYPAGGLSSYTGQIAAKITSPTFSNDVTGTDPVIFQQLPVITWASPAPILFGTPLGAAQLNAASTVAGTFAYAPSAGSLLPVGSHVLSTTLTPANSVYYVPASATTTLTVLTATPTVTVTSNQNPVFLANPVTFTATVSSLGTVIPTGTIKFYDGTTQIGAGTLASGATTVTLSTLTLGTHAITAVYSGDATYNPATSAALPQLVDDFTIKVTGTGAATLGLGESATFPLTFSPVLGTILPGAITFTVSGMLPETSYTFSPASLAAGIPASTDNFKVSMASTFANGQKPSSWPRQGAPLLLSLLLLPFAARLRRMGRRWQNLTLIALASLALAASLAACSFEYTPKSSTVTVTATSGNLSHTTTVNVTVK